MASSISSVILKNVVNELQNNVAAEMTRFQQQISALDAIIRHSSNTSLTVIESEPSVDTVSKAQHEEIFNIHNQLGHISSCIDKHTGVLDTMNNHIHTVIHNEINKLSETYKLINESVAQSFEVLGNAFNQQTDRIMSLEAKYVALESRVSALTINNVANELIEHNTDIIMESPEEIIKETTTPPNTPSSSECGVEPDIEETNVNYESEAEPDIEDDVPEPADAEPDIEDDLPEATDAEPEVKEQEVSLNAEEDEEAEEEVEEEAEEEEESEVEYEEVTYKGTTYYVDPDNIAYTMDDEGSLNEDPVGVWVPEKKIVRFYKK